MKNKTLAGLIVAGLLMSGAAFSLLAQNGSGQGRNGKGYGGPPQSQEERAARQAACLEKNGGVCPNGGPRTNCPAGGMDCATAQARAARTARVRTLRRKRKNSGTGQQAIRAAMVVARIPRRTRT